MNNEQAEKKVHDYLSRRIEITRCTVPPENVNFYEFNPNKEHLFTFKLFGHNSIGSAEYIAVDQGSGDVRYLGFFGE